MMSGRYRADAPAGAVALAEQLREHIWYTAKELMADEVKHNLTCTDDKCGGVIFPWLAQHIDSVEAGIAFACIVMEKCADGVAGMMKGERLPPDPEAPQAGDPLADAMAAFDRVMQAAEQRHAQRAQGGDDAAV